MITPAQAQEFRQASNDNPIEEIVDMGLLKSPDEYNTITVYVSEIWYSQVEVFNALKPYKAHWEVFYRGTETIANRGSMHELWFKPKE